MKNFVFTWILILLIFVPSKLIAEEISFNRDIRPILSSKCFFCHGPSEKSRKANLRLDSAKEAFNVKDGIAAFVKNSLNDSEAWHRINSNDKDEVMPPPEFKNELTKIEIETIKKWIQGGAEWQEHWSYLPLSKPKSEIQSDWIKNDIDKFVLKTLQKKNLEPSPEADKRTLIRRLYFDLTGLPPSINDIHSFLNDDSENAYEKVVDKLLASDSYAERMTLIWMDAARYGDTSVFHDDGPRTMWPWRDWVLNAYKNNMPYDQFSIEQLAGDLLPNATNQQKIASGFNRNHATTDEGGVIPEEFRVEYVVDRVKTTGNVWMGLTMECAQCHDHKYDPISHEEYYQFYAFYNNNADPGMQTRRGNTAPMIEIISKSDAEAKENLRNQIKTFDSEIKAREKESKNDFENWIVSETNKIKKDNLNYEQHKNQIHYFSLNDYSKNDKFKVVRKPIQVNGKFKKAIKIDKNSYLEVKNITEFENNESFSIGVWINLDNANKTGAVLSKMNEDNDFRGYDVWLENGKFGTHIIHKWPENALKVVSENKLKAKTWNHLMITYNGNKNVNGIELYLNGVKQKKQIQKNNLKDTIKTKNTFKIGGRSKTAFVNGATIDEIKIYNKKLDAQEVKSESKNNDIKPLLLIANDKRTDDENQTLKNHYLENVDTQYKKLVANKNKVNAEIQKMEKNKITSMIMGDNIESKKRKTYLLMRGQYSAPDESKEIFPNTPQFLPPMKKDLPKNRLGLAKWLLDKENPLTARVAMNRHWQIIFGSPLVSTPGDFGSQGAWPTNIDLLNYLASDFIESNYDVKRSFKQMVMSATYRQSSVVQPQHSEKDPTNLYYARSSRFRLLGEFVRDNALAVSGLLNTKFGGPSVKPYQPEGLWNEVSLNGGRRFVRDNGEDLYRKSMYIYWKRSAPHPGMLAFDVPTRETCTIQRQNTNTPMQALVTLNDEQFVEAARVFASKVLLANKTFESQLNYAFETATGKPADELRQKVFLNLYEQQKKIFTAEPQRANDLLSIGETKANESIDKIEHASWTILTSTILNLDETLNRE